MTTTFGSRAHAPGSGSVRTPRCDKLCFTVSGSVRAEALELPKLYASTKAKKPELTRVGG